MVPWLIVYGLNILGLFGSSIFLFYTLDGNFKLIGLIPLALSIGLLAGHITVMYFLAEQRNDQLSGACENIVDSEQSTPSWATRNKLEYFVSKLTVHTLSWKEC